jgi:hypothetical protein
MTTSEAVILFLKSSLKTSITVLVSSEQDKDPDSLQTSQHLAMKASSNVQQMNAENHTK